MAIKIEGLDKVLADFKKFGDDGKKVVTKNLTNTATAILEGAARDVPKLNEEGIPYNILQRLDQEVKDGGLTVLAGIQSVRQEGEFAVWFEFGTGLSAQQLLSGSDYTDEIRTLAATFIRNRKGTIEQQAYLFPNFFKQSPILLDKLERDLKNLAGKV
jgi:hypothetical protein